MHTRKKEEYLFSSFSNKTLFSIFSRDLDFLRSGSFDTITPATAFHRKIRISSNGQFALSHRYRGPLNHISRNRNNNECTRETPFIKERGRKIIVNFRINKPRVFE